MLDFSLDVDAIRV